jgi:hypothetical protein
MSNASTKKSMLIVYTNLNWSNHPEDPNYEFNRDLWQQARKWIEQNYPEEL